MEFNDVIRARRSIRRFNDRQPDPAVVSTIVDQARRAPTAGFSQGVDFLVLDSPEALVDFWESIEDPQFPSDEEDLDARPPVLVLVWSDPQRYIERYSAPDKIEFGMDDIENWPVRFWDVDAGMASMQLQLAAVNAGLDTWFFGIPYGEDAVRERFGVPPHRKQDRRHRAGLSQRRRAARQLGHQPTPPSAGGAAPPQRLVAAATTPRELPRRTPTTVSAAPRGERRRQGRDPS